ncbi:hypothetical protein [Streptomyces netropsis]|uniref:Uncharacterized protein n=1 Tax=Streptomyces netropsis TaxID=55404 RepID=A0A7W7L8H5_STRNE|nr:hypothetical protein [Streptomyces netropsis]MBB4885522.1 hypothetical protein [Streptomyces netropsis]GGR38749.1 hypothetical protein GCM10010219_49880 [Streptomyces netropsis]
MTTSKTPTTPGAARQPGHDCGCGCGGAGGPAPHDHAGGFRAGGPVRPVFFAGQLLTEDDLGQLTTWITGRVRTHNRLRHVSPDGLGAVVCGLAVGCDSCARGEVRVGEGHAVDGSGNDIPVVCAEDVDVVKLVREFRAAGGGCPEPCPPPGPERTYALFLRYDEEFAEPVAPYDPGDGCTPAGCVPTRIREGHRFVVGCVPDPPSDHLCATLRRRFDDDRAFLEACRDEATRPPASVLTPWLLARLDANGDLCDRAPGEILGGLPPKSSGNDPYLNRLRKDGAWEAFAAYLRTAVRSLLVVPGPGGCEPLVLVAEVTLDGCDVVRAVPAGRRGPHLPDPEEQRWRGRLARLFEGEVSTTGLLEFLLDLLDVTGCLPRRPTDT